MSSYGLKTVPTSLRVLRCTLLVGLSRNNCVGVACIVTPHLGYCMRVVQAARRVRRSLFIVLSINLVILALKRLSLKYTRKNAFCAITQNVFFLCTKVFVCSTINAFVIYLEGRLETLEKERKLGKKFSKT